MSTNVPSIDSRLHLLDLPPEILLDTFLRLGYEDLLQLSSTGKFLRRLIEVVHERIKPRAGFVMHPVFDREGQLPALPFNGVEDAKALNEDATYPAVSILRLGPDMGFRLIKTQGQAVKVLDVLQKCQEYWSELVDVYGDDYGGGIERRSHEVIPHRGLGSPINPELMKTVWPAFRLAFGRLAHSPDLRLNSFLGEGKI